MWKRLIRCALTLSALIVWTVTGGQGESPAAAATLGHLQVRQSMMFVGFDATVARAHGYRIVTRADGSERVVSVDSAASPVQDTVWGNCGYSYVEGEISGRHQIWLNRVQAVESLVVQPEPVHLLDRQGRPDERGDPD
jgi:hypothetical protein